MSSEDPAVAVVSYQIRKADLTVSADPAGNGIQVQKLGYGQEMTEGERRRAPSMEKSWISASAPRI